MRWEMIIGNSKKFYIQVRNCPRRSLDATKLQKYLVLNNLKPATSPKKADYVFVFTCGGFKQAEQESLYTIEKAMKNRNSEVIVTGCLPKINPDKLKAYDLPFVSPEDFERLDQLINAKVPYSECPEVSCVEGVHRLYHKDLLKRIRQRMRFLKGFVRSCSAVLGISSRNQISYFSKENYILEIAKGCVGNCSYCAIKLAMPKYKSTAKEVIIEKFGEGLQQDFKKFTLMAGDIGCYGVDIKTNLPSLLEEIFKIKADYKLFLCDLNARWFVRYYDQFLSVLKKNSSKIDKIIMPIQSGSDRILKLMNRHYQINQVKDRIIEIQKEVRDLKIETHIIVGFPGETEQDFQKSVDLVKQVPFSKVAVFQYEDRPNTAAFYLTEKIPKRIIESRVKRLKQEVKVVVQN